MSHVIVGSGWGGVVDGGSLCRMSFIRNGYVALSNLRKRHVALSNLERAMSHVANA